MNINVDSIGGNCPVQAQGTVDGVSFYFRSRGEGWSFSVGADPLSVLMGQEEGFNYWEDYPGGAYAAGWIEEEEALSFIETGARLYALWREQQAK